MFHICAREKQWHGLFLAMPASSQDVRAKTTPVASTDSAEYFHDGFRGLIENSLQGILIHQGLAADICE